MRVLYFSLLAVLLLSLVSAEARTRFHEYTELYYSPQDAARPLVASYLGGGGDEYLAGAAFLPNGGLILAGQSLGPNLALPGVAVGVIGRDTVGAPNFTMPRGRNDNVATIRSWQEQGGRDFWSN